MSGSPGWNGDCSTESIRIFEFNRSLLYYAVFQTNGWTGGLSVTFDLSEAGSVVQTATVGGSPIGLKSHSTLEVGGAGRRRLVQAFVGISSSNGETGFPCGPPGCPYPVPTNAVAVQPAQFQGAPGNGTIYYAAFQAYEWRGGTDSTGEVIEGNNIVYTPGVSGGIAGSLDIELTAAGGGPLTGDYEGPATLKVITTALQRGDGAPPFTADILCAP
jgi:hypothetical protein